MNQAITVINNKIKRCLLSEIRPFLEKSIDYVDGVYVDNIGNNWVVVSDEDIIGFYYDRFNVDYYNICDLPIVPPNENSIEIKNGWKEFVIKDKKSNKDVRYDFF